MKNDSEIDDRSSEINGALRISMGSGPKAPRRRFPLRFFDNLVRMVTVIRYDSSTR